MWWPKESQTAASKPTHNARSSSAPGTSRRSSTRCDLSPIRTTRLWKTAPAFKISSSTLPSPFPTPTNAEKTDASIKGLTKRSADKTKLLISNGEIDEALTKRKREHRQKLQCTSASQAPSNGISSFSKPRAASLSGFSRPRAASLPTLDCSHQPKATGRRKTAPAFNDLSTTLPNHLSTPTSSGKKLDKRKLAEDAKCEQNYVSRISKELNMPREAMMQACDLFRRHADNPPNSTGSLWTGILRKQGFAKLWLEMTDRDSGDEAIVPSEVWKEALRHAGPGITNCLGFEHFAAWFSSRYFCEAVSVSPPRRHLRSIARKFSMHHGDVETYNQLFARFDEDGSGTIDRQEFEKLLYQCTKVPEDVGLPPARIKHFWQIADDDGSQEIEFDEFLTFYKTYLGTDSTGFEDFYRPKGRHSVTA